MRDVLIAAYERRILTSGDLMPTSKSKESLIRTSVQLPASTLQMLDERWPGLTRSEALRLALERFEYFDWKSQYCAKLMEKYGEDFVFALADFDYSDFRAVARALPSLVEGYVKEEGLMSGGGKEKDLIEMLERLESHDRLQILDFAVSERQKVDAQ
jgi:hypothetical protein